MAHVYLSLGSNLEEPITQLRRAIDLLRGLGIVSAVSSFYQTKPWGDIPDQPDFINAVVALETELSPHDLLAAVKSIEARMGRTSEAARWGPRIIDVDILTYDHIAVDEPHLQIPHPRMNNRAFVLVPLVELDESFATALRDLPDSERLTASKVVS